MRDLLRRLTSDEPIEVIVSDLPYGFVNEVRNDGLLWPDINRILLMLVSIIRQILTDNSMSSINQSELNGRLEA
jgi:hypothetical protein